MRSRLDRLEHKAEEVGMLQDRERELAEINLRQKLADGEKGEINGELMTDMILNDLMYDTALELQSIEDDDNIKDEAVTMHHNPTLENIYQRLEQMELEQNDIRRRWGTLHFEEEEEGLSLRKARKIEKPSGPVALEITRKDPSASHSTRAYDKNTDAPIIFTKSAPAPQFSQRATVVETEEDLDSDLPLGLPLRSGKIRLKLPDTAVRDIHSNLEKYERYLKKTSHQAHGKFDPWKLVEEISDQVLSECLKEIEKELEDVEENIVHQVCKSEFALPEPSALQQEVQDDRDEDYGYDIHAEGMGGLDKLDQLRTIQEEYGIQTSQEYSARTSQQEIESALRGSGEKSILQSSADKSRENGTSSKKEVSFHQDVLSERSDSYERGREVLFDAADLDIAEIDGETPRGASEIRTDEYDDDSYEDEEESEISITATDDLEYSEDET